MPVSDAVRECTDLSSRRDVGSSRSLRFSVGPQDWTFEWELGRVGLCTLPDYAGFESAHAPVCLCMLPARRFPARVERDAGAPEGNTSYVGGPYPWCAA